MLRRTLALLVAITALPVVARAQVANPAYSLDDVVSLLKRRVASQRILDIVKTDCLSFAIDPDAETKLHAAGASTTLLTSLKAVCYRPVGAPPSAAVPQASLDTGLTVSVRAAIIGADMTIKPLPLVDLLFLGANGDTVRMQTDLSGLASGTVKNGAWVVSSAQPVQMGNVKYHWAVPVSVAPGMRSVELTNRNATADSVVVVVQEPPKKKVSEEAALFDQVKGGVFTVYGDENKGVGFLVDIAGLIVTDLRLLHGTKDMHVVIDSSTQVHAKLITADSAHGIAYLAIPMSRCGACTVLHVVDTSRGPVASVGDRVLAVGSPTNLRGRLSIGIVNSVDPSGIVSDIAVSWMNSGSPLINTDGNVVAINSYTAGVNSATRSATSLPITSISASLEKARLLIGHLPGAVPSDSMLPVFPREPFPTTPLQAVAANPMFDVQPYTAAMGTYRVFMMTPQIMAWREAQAKQALAVFRSRKGAAGMAVDHVDPIQNWTEWSEFLQDRRAVVVFNVTSDRNQFPFYDADKLVDGRPDDVWEIQVQRDGRDVQPVERWRMPGVVNADEYRLKGKVAPMQVIYVYRAEDFGPRADGSVANYSVLVHSALHPTVPVMVPLTSKMIESIWRDFAPYRFSGSR